MTMLVVKAIIDNSTIPFGTEKLTPDNGSSHDEDEKTALDEDKQTIEDWSEEDQKTVLRLWNGLTEEEKEAATRVSYQYCDFSAGTSQEDDEENNNDDDGNDDDDDMSRRNNNELDDLREEYRFLLMRRFWIAIRDIPFTAFAP